MTSSCQSSSMHFSHFHSVVHPDSGSGHIFSWETSSYAKSFQPVLQWWKRLMLVYKICEEPLITCRMPSSMRFSHFHAYGHPGILMFLMTGILVGTRLWRNLQLHYTHENSAKTSCYGDECAFIGFAKSLWYGATCNANCIEGGSRRNSGTGRL